MLNMLYCIVFDSYAFVKTRAGAPLTLYAQIRDAAATARETRGFVNLYTLIVQLEEPFGLVHGRKSCGYGSIPINTIFRGMNIHLPAILMFTRGTRF